MRPGRKTQYQKTTRPPDFLLEYWSTIGEHKKRQEILKWQQRKKDIDEAIAKRNLLRVPVDPSNYTIPAASVKHRPPSIGTDDDDGPIPLLTHESDDESFVASDKSSDQSESDNEDVEFCDLCNKPAWLHKYCRSNRKTVCQQMFCMFVKNRKKYPWLRDPVPAMHLSVASSSDQPSPADDLFSYDDDIPNSDTLSANLVLLSFNASKPFSE